MMEGASHTVGRDQLINLCVYGVPPAPVYKGARGEVRPARRGRARRSPTPTGSRTPSLFLVGLGVEGERGGREEGKGGRRPPLLVLFGLGDEGRAALPWLPLLFSTKAHYGPLSPRGFR